MRPRIVGRGPGGIPRAQAGRSRVRVDSGPGGTFCREGSRMTAARKAQGPGHSRAFRSRQRPACNRYAVACCTHRHSLASPRRGTTELSPIVAKESRRSEAKARQNGRPDCRKVFLANHMRNVHSFSRSGVFSSANPVQTPECHRSHHITLRPASFTAQRNRQRYVLQFMVPLFDGAWFHCRDWHHRHQLTMTFGNDHHWPFFHHFGRPKARVEITD